MADTGLILQSLEGMETRIRGDLRDLGVRVGALEVIQGQHALRFDRLDKDFQGFSATCKYAGHEIAENGHKGIGSLLTFLGVLTDAPKLWHVLLVIAAGIVMLAPTIKKLIP